jgi:hypothetical protein
MPIGPSYRKDALLFENTYRRFTGSGCVEDGIREH